MRRWAGLLVSTVLVLLVGCAAPTPKVNLKTGALRSGQAIALVEPPPITHYFMYSAHPGMAFGAIGGAIAGLQFEAQGKEVASLMAQQGLVPHAEIAEAFRRDLTNAGFEVRLVQGAWVMEGNTPRLDMSRVPASHDRVLVLTPSTFGFYSRGLNGNYEPSLRLRVALYGTNRQVPLYDGHHIAGLQPVGAGWVLVPPVKTQFASYQLMISQPAAMAQALRSGIDAVARSAMSDMRLAAGNTTAASSVRQPAARQEYKELAGDWRGTMKCGEYTGPGHTENPRPWTQPVTLTVDGAELVMTRGGASTNYDERLVGSIAADYTASAQGQGWMHRSPSAPWYTQASGRFEMAGASPQFVGNAMIRNVHGNVLRNCTLSLARIPAG